MKFLLAFCLIAFLAAVHGYSVPGAFQKMQEIKSSVKSLTQKFNKSPKTVAQCETELLPIMIALSGNTCSYRYFAMNISNMSNPNPINFTDAVAARDAMCAACDVAAQRTALLGTTYCQGNEETFMMVRLMLDMQALECHKTGGTDYCFDQVFGGDSEGNGDDSGSDTPPTQAELRTFCTDTCFNTVANFIQTTVPCLVPFQFLTIMCETDAAGAYCTQNLFTLEQSYLNFSSRDLLTATQEGAFHDALEPFCEDCGNSIYANWFTTKANEVAQCPLGAYGTDEPENNYYGLMCDVDAEGDLCLPHIREFNFTNGGNFTDCPRNGGFSNYTTNMDCGTTTGCQAAQISISTTFGCCYNSIIELFNGYSEVGAGKLWAEGTCGTPVNPICQSLVEFQGEPDAGYKNQPTALLSVLSASVLMLMW